MKIAHRFCWNRLRLRLRGRAVTITRQALAAGLFVTAAVLAVRPNTAGPPPGPVQSSATSNLALATAPGSATVPLRLADPGVTELLARGMRVDVVTADSGTPGQKVLASMATVVDVRSPPQPEDHLLSSDRKGPLVLVSLPVDVARQVAAFSLRGPVAVTFR